MRLVLPTVLLMLLASCSQSSDVATVPRDVPFSTVYYGTSDYGHRSGIEPVTEPKILRFSNPTEFAEFWSLHDSRLPIPEMDFTAHDILVLMDRLRFSSYHRIRVEGIVAQGDDWFLEATQLEPAANCVLLTICGQPAHIISVAKGGDTFGLNVESGIRPCPDKSN